MFLAINFRIFMEISFTNEELKKFYSSLENFADAAKRSNGSVNEDKILAILQYLGLATNGGIINKAKTYINLFNNLINDSCLNKQAGLVKLVDNGIPLKFAEPVIDILFEGKSENLGKGQNSGNENYSSDWGLEKESLKSYKCPRCKKNTLFLNASTSLFECHNRYCKARFTEKELISKNQNLI
jgi:ribosomal protein L37AE/L43A